MPTFFAVQDPQHVQDENGDIVGYLKDQNTIVFTRPYGVAVAGNKTLSRTDLGQMQDCSAAAELTIPTDVVLGITDPKARVVLSSYQQTAGAVTWVPGAGVSPLRSTVPTPAQYLTIGLVHVGANEWAYL
jgi:hypothetical protein